MNISLSFIRSYTVNTGKLLLEPYAFYAFLTSEQNNIIDSRYNNLYPKYIYPSV